ncbi:MAG: PSD1 and planctomycete cytochrome C domain-containing protein [Gemmataceae bacterium]|nr:PSD1 and planctomycete cytochrome C domain-containing protein [Gemmataceae bacterium]
MRSKLWTTLALGSLVLLPAVGPRAQEKPAADRQAFFAQKVAPLLQARCLECHNPTKSRGGLDLSTRALAVAGGDKGPAIVPGDAGKSLLLRMIDGPEPKMPRQRQPLSRAEVAALRKWLDDGAAWPEKVVLAAAGPGGKGDGVWWSLRPLNRPAVPAVKDPAWVRNPIDSFVLAMLEAKKLRPSPPADRATFIRRATIDLHGLPPTPEEVAAFVNDPSPEAFEKLIDRLLASPRYGERWARHWLDIIHYADTHGFDKDKMRLWAWLFRDWLIRAFNRDLPYRRFTRQQIAGDILWPDDPEGLIATGFVVAGPWDFVGHVELREGTVEKEKTRTLDRDDMVANVASTFLSLTVHCARCHDHKFDPIPQKDYYRLQAVFAGIERGDRPFKALAESAKVYAPLPRPPRPIHVLHRGDVERKGELATPGALSLLAGLDPNFQLARPEDEGVRRVALADWITDPKNVLTWRSVVNRVWHYHFGRGIVDTPNDFGRNGSLPTHPELLDWLAVEFRDGGQSFKQLHRLIMLSSAYRQASAHDEAKAKLDADNRYLWRQNRQRLDAESVRDSVLAVSGTLSLKMYGPGYQLFRYKDDHSPVYDHSDVTKINDPANWRRTVYRFVVRSVPNHFLDNLDCADPNISTPVRNTTLTALQALALLNNPFMVKQAEHFARRLEGLASDLEGRVEAAYRLAFGRAPTRPERAAVVAYARRHGLANACRLLLNANEFVFID